MTAGAARAGLFDAVVLAGGRGSRLGGADKAGIRIDGARLVDRVAAAATRAGATQVVVVGPDRAAAAGSVTVREDPPFSGPLAAVAAALPLVEADWVLLLSCDLEHPDAVCARLVEAWGRAVAAGAWASRGGPGGPVSPGAPVSPAPGEPGAPVSPAPGEPVESGVPGEPASVQPASAPLDGVLLSDTEGRTQWLAGVYRASMLRRRVDELGAGLADRPLRHLFAGAGLVEVEAPSWETADIDEPGDLRRAGAE